MDAPRQSPHQAVAPRLDALGVRADRPLLIVDVDEVLALFMHGFGAFLADRGYEFRVERFALFQNIFRPGAAEHLELAQGKVLLDGFFRSHCDQIEPAPGAVEALNRLARQAAIVILSNAPPEAERLRADWLKRRGMDYPLILNNGPKGPLAAALVGQTTGRTAFVDDLLSNLDSVAAHAPATATFQHVADERLRPLAPRSDRHPRIDDWADLALALEAALRAGPAT